MRNTELVVLRGFVSETEISDGQRDVFGTADGGPLLRLLLEGDFEAVLLSPPVLDLLTGDGGTSESLEAYLEERVLTYLDAAAGDQTQDSFTETNDTDWLARQTRKNRQNVVFHKSPLGCRWETVVLAMAVSCLGLFAQSNWTGPPITLQVSDLLPVCVLDRYSEDGALTSAVLSHLLLDGECVYSLVLNPFLLLVARVLLVNCATKLEHLQLLPWWTLRYTALHQQILEERSPQLFSLAKSCMDKVCMREDLLSDGAHRNLALLFHLECSYACLTYYEYRKAKDHLQKARQLSGLEINMTGALGKRTRFQENFLAQLILSVKRKDDSPVPESEGNLSPAPTPRHLLPKDHQLDDDTVLNQMTLAEPCELQLPELRAEEQALILGVCTDFQKNNPVHKLNEEELLAFTTKFCRVPTPRSGPPCPDTALWAAVSRHRALGRRVPTPRSGPPCPDTALWAAVSRHRALGRRVPTPRSEPPCPDTALWAAVSRHRARGRRVLICEKGRSIFHGSCADMFTPDLRDTFLFSPYLVTELTEALLELVMDAEFCAAGSLSSSSQANRTYVATRALCPIVPLILGALAAPVRPVKTPVLVLMDLCRNKMSGHVFELPAAVSGPVARLTDNDSIFPAYTWIQESAGWARVVSLQGVRGQPAGRTWPSCRAHVAILQGTSGQPAGHQWSACRARVAILQGARGHPAGRAWPSCRARVAILQGARGHPAGHTWSACRAPVVSLQGTSGQPAGHQWPSCRARVVSLQGARGQPAGHTCLH
ncbi:uncharacterized protein LOC143506837 [Brachyhypopomus gauderio]|uniref:uncharacterized protein LOC143506837 n=1 Tax=Brachyhypopomus gauderio TaxID=698409 RepID=UPI0040435EEC